MKSKKEKIEKLEKALLLAYRDQAVRAFAPDWRLGVMRRIRSLGVKERMETQGILETLAFRRIILPFASATVLAAVVFLFLASKSIVGIEYDVMAFLVEDSTGLFSQQLLNF